MIKFYCSPTEKSGRADVAIIPKPGDLHMIERYQREILGSFLTWGIRPVIFYHRSFFIVIYPNLDLVNSFLTV